MFLTKVLNNLTGNYSTDSNKLKLNIKKSSDILLFFIQIIKHNDHTYIIKALSTLRKHPRRFLLKTDATL